MDEIIRTNDPVVLSFAQSLLNDFDIPHMVADQGMSVLEGSIGVLQRRLLVPSDFADRARRVLIDAGLGPELRESR